MFRILKHHIDGLIFQYNFLEGDNVLVAYFSIELYYVINADNNEQTQYTHSNFTNCALADSSVCRYVSILVRFKFLDGMESGILVLALCFIDPAVSPRRDETKNGVFECDTTMSFIALGTVNSHHIMLYCLRPVVNHERKRKRSMNHNDGSDKAAGTGPGLGALALDILTQSCAQSPRRTSYTCLDAEYPIIMTVRFYTTVPINADRPFL